ncbi:hypothetical protein, partial [Reyranella sp.]|uniref:hypothetical protein n=1 Tax=Reyranella sp. TaxID=1929291 RepID=UPI002F93A543
SRVLFHREVRLHRLLVGLLMGATVLSVARNQFEDLKAERAGAHIEAAALRDFCSIESPSPDAGQSVHAAMFPDPATLVAGVAEWIIDAYCQPPS